MDIYVFDAGGEFLCPRAPGFWKNHPEQWPVDTLVIGVVSYDFYELMALLDYGGPDVSTRLARQLVAAKLNLNAGTDPVILPVVDEADAFLEVYPPDSDPMKIDKAVANDLKNQLEQYNDGSCEGE